MHTAPALSASDSSDTPLLPDQPARARASLLGTDELSVRQHRLDERLRTLCLVVLALAVLAAAAHYLRTVLVRFVLALALYYLLTPCVDLVLALPAVGVGRCRCRVPRGVAIVLVVGVGAGTLVLLGFVLAHAAGTFASHANEYKARLDEASARLLGAAHAVQGALGPASAALGQGRVNDNLHEAVKEAVKALDVPKLITRLLGFTAHAAENGLYIVMFLAFLLAGGRRADGAPRSRAESQIYTYIRGKVLICAVVGLLDGGCLWLAGVELWLVFGILAFWLSFIPNVGLLVAVALPMPLVLLEPAFTLPRAALAFLGPLGCGLAVKDVLEPLLIGRATSLQPVAVLLAVMCWGSVWGVTGMILAVPITAVARIHLAELDHPLSRYLAQLLSGRDDEEAQRDEQGWGDAV